MTYKTVAQKIEDFIIKEMKFDAAHDLSHIKRVVKSGMEMGKMENANLDVIFPACWLHDCVNVPKTSKNRSLGSKFSAERAIEFLKEIGYSPMLLDEIHHAILAHSFSANIETKTLEAKIVQDADRLDALGALGISRCLMYSAGANRPLYNVDDPFADNRELDDADNAIDHFYTKLGTLPSTMKTKSGRDIADQRWEYMKGFISQLKSEILQ
jgi:uncharacterized protein